ncbi:hypothetical protein BDV96DRAFT_577108 [Lophiotrema nucula]|uniref:Uncharacterized protein n=1 Tax=Lophiotrema nucula TaxID=690887 RepID=A0A6A5Z543_9PLEO|nr:hypothetical protein BDV96DRAFT_577108 [Lophiotrema nucula]
MSNHLRTTRLTEAGVYSHSHSKLLRDWLTSSRVYWSVHARVRSFYGRINAQKLCLYTDGD